MSDWPTDTPFASGRDAHGRYVVGHQLSRPNPTQFAPGNFDAATHLQRTDRLPPALAYLHEEVRAFVEASVVDDGGAAEVPARRRTLHEYRGRLHRRILALDTQLELRGMVDRRGRLRVTWLQQLAGLIERARQLDVTLGLERRAKRTPSLAEYLEQRAAAAPLVNETPDGGAARDS